MKNYTLLMTFLSFLSSKAANSQQFAMEQRNDLFEFIAAGRSGGGGWGDLEKGSDFEFRAYVRQKPSYRDSLYFIRKAASYYPIITRYVMADSTSWFTGVEVTYRSLPSNSIYVRWYRKIETYRTEKKSEQERLEELLNVLPFRWYGRADSNLVSIMLDTTTFLNLAMSMRDYCDALAAVVNGAVLLGKQKDIDIAIVGTPDRFTYSKKTNFIKMWTMSRFAALNHY